MTKSPAAAAAAAGLRDLPSSEKSANNSAIEGRGEEHRRTLGAQQLSEFALTDSLRKSVSSSLRKRAQNLNYGGGDSETETVKTKAVQIEETENSGVRRSLRVKRSTKSQNRFVSSSRLHSLVVSGEARDPLSSSDCGEYRRLDARFFECDALELAPKLLGKLIRREDVILQITEVEAYRPNDTACHARVGRTARTEPLFGPAGHAYVYLCYGLHVMLNVVADRVDVGAAVLIRACSPVAGLKIIQDRRGQVTEKPVLLTGPGKVGQALGLTTDWTSHPLYTTGGLEILDAPSPGKILVGPRVGIDYAEPNDVAALWRFALSDTLWVSAPRSTLRPLQSDSILSTFPSEP